MMNALLIALIGAFLWYSGCCNDVKATEPVEYGHFTSFSQLMDRGVVPLPIAKTFSLNDRHDVKVCILNNIYSNHQDVPKECSCSFDRLRSMELQCANDATKSGIDCGKNICETCCIISLSSSFAKEFQNMDHPVKCKIRCLNSPVVSDVTQDSQQFLSQYLRMINALYHPEVQARKDREKEHIPTQYHVIPLADHNEEPL